MQDKLISASKSTFPNIVFEFLHAPAPLQSQYIPEAVSKSLMDQFYNSNMLYGDTNTAIVEMKCIVCGAANPHVCASCGIPMFCSEECRKKGE